VHSFDALDFTSLWTQPSTMSQVQNNGITGTVNASLPVLMTMVAFSTIALYNVIELNAIIFTTFKRRQGLYFWSFIVATWGIVPHTIGFIVSFFDVTSVWWAPLILISFGWFAMVSGQSMVLYSRLHIVAGSEGRIRWVLCMIIFDAIVLGIPDNILAFLSHRPNAHASVVDAFSIFDKIQVGGFFVQEVIISAFYIYETVRLLGPIGGRKQNPLRKLLSHLILINIIVLIFDATLLGTEYSGNFEIQVTYKPAIYSIKLKLEFSVLNRLIDVVKNKELAVSSPSYNSNSCPLSFATNTMGSPANSRSMDDAVMGDQRLRVKTTEIFVGSANRSDHAFSELKLGK
jgi:hypothetical protein